MFFFSFFYYSFINCLLLAFDYVLTSTSLVLILLLSPCCIVCPTITDDDYSLESKSLIYNACGVVMLI